MALIQNQKKYSAEISSEDLKKFYLKKIGERGRFSIWEVDGAKIRGELNAEFSNFGQHFRFPFIPKYEFWLDREKTPGESNFFIDHLLAEWQLMNQGIIYSKVRRIAGNKEKSERKKTNNFKPLENSGVPAENMHRQLLGKSGKISAWLVYGQQVRDVFDIDFTEGGHDLIYKFIPKNEIWIDDDVVSAERECIILHELFERSLMEKQNFSYTRAHWQASELEWQSRHNKTKLLESLDNLGWKPA